jgi:hypothetical protein
MKIDIATILLASVFALGNGTGYARTAEDALKTRPKEDNRAAVDAIAKQAAGARVSNAEARKWLDSIDYSSADPAEIRRRTIDWILKCSAKKEECRELFNGGFSLKNAAVSFSPDVFYPGWRMKSAVCDLKRKNGGACGWKISDGEEKGAYGFSGSSSFSPNGENGFDASFVYEAVKDIKVKHVFVGASFGVE